MHTQDNLLSDFLKEADAQDTLRAAKAHVENRGSRPEPKPNPTPNPTPKPKPKSKPNPTPKSTSTTAHTPTRKNPLKLNLPPAVRPYTRLTSTWPSKPKVGKVGIATALLAILGIGGTGGYALRSGGDDEDVVDYGKAEEATPTPDTEAPSGPDPVTYGAGGALLGGGVSHAWGKMAGRPDLARDLIAALGTGIAGATYAATRESNE